MDEWEELFNEKHQRKYWKNKKTGKSSWHDPAKGEGGATAAASSETVAVKAEGAATSAGGAEEWEELFSDKHNRKYWKNKVTGKSSWTAPETTVASKPAAAAEASSSSSAAAASEWEELYNEKHKRKYWKNKVTGKSSWTAPEVAASAAATENKVAQESQAEEWEELFSEKHNRKYWKSKLTGKSSWTAPPAKPAVEASTASESKAAAADEWEELYNDKHKRKYWKNKVTGKSSWTKPEVTVAASAETKGSATETKPATEEWEELFNEKHKRKYWKNKVTGKTSWTPPPAAAPGATSSAATSIPSKAEEKKETIVIKPFEMLFRSSLKVGELKNEDSNKQFWSQLSGTMDNLSLELYAITTPEDITNKLLPEISSTTSFIEGCTEFRKIQTSNIATITCNTARGTVAIELNEGGGESENKGETGSTANQHNNNLVLVFNSPTAAYKCLQTLKRAKAMKDKIEAAEKDEDKSKLQKLIVDHSNKFRILQQYSSLETFVTAFDLNQILGPMLKLEGGFALSDLQVFRQQPSLRPELLSQVVVLEEKFTQEWKKFHSNIKSSLTKFAMEEVSTLPLEGIAVIKVSFQTTTTSNDTQQLSWMPCWIKLDQTGRNIAFHEHGPTQTSSFIVNCQSAQIHLKDMTEYGENIEIHLKNAKLVVNDANSKMMNVQFLFKTCDELWRWCLALSSICGEMAWQSAEHNHHVNIDTSFNIADKTVLSNPLSFVHFQSTASDVLTALEYPLAEREVSSELIRYHQITGADLKTAKFQILNQRIYVQNKGSAESLVEGSVLLSINGLSAIQLPGKTVMKFVSEVPKQMTTDVAVIKFPRAEYVVEAVEIEDALRSLEASLPVESKLTLGNPVNLSGSGVGAKKLDAESASQLQKMIIRKRSFIAQPGSLQDIIDAKANAAAESANNNNESNSKKTSESITIEKFKNSDQNDLKWTKYRIAITAGKVVLVAINQNGTHKFQLQTTHLRVIFSKQLSSLSQLCLELVDNKSHVVIRCPTYKIFQSLFRKLVIGLKLYGSLPIDLTWAYHQADKWRRGRDVLQFTDAMQPSPTVVTSGILAQMKLNEDKQKSMDAEDETNQSTVAHSIAGGEEPHNGLMHAAELLEQSLLQLDLPHSFPTASVVEQQIRELRGLNRTNHQMMSDFLTLQLDYSFPSSSNVAPVEPAVITQKSPFFNYNDSSTNNEESGGGNLNGDDEDVHEYNPSIDTPARSEAWEGDNNDMNELNPVPLSAPSNRRSSGINLTIDSGTGAPPPPSKNKLTRRASARMSISLESTNSLLAAAGIPGANTNVMSTRNAPPIAVMPSKPLSLSMEEQSALSTIFVHLRETPQDLLALVQKLNTAQDLGVFAHVLVNRIFSQWSCDQKQLEAVLDLLLQPEQPKSSIQQAINVGSLLYAQEKEEGKGNAYHLSIGDFAQALTSFKTSMAPSPSPMLIYILYEIVCRVDVVAFVEHLCSDMIVDTLVINSNVSEICSTIVEPLCSKLENAIDASQIPDILVYVMKLLAKYYHQNIHPKEFLASFLVPFVVNTITIVHKKKEENGNPTLDDHHLNVVVHRVKDLLMLCFDQSAAEKKLQLCLSDTAALSRSKWMLTR